MLTRARSLGLALAVLLAATAPRLGRAQDPADNGGPWPQPTRIVAVADVHGAYDALVGLLQAEDVIDAQLRWTGGATQVVSLGDLIDRGPDTRRVLDLVMRLQGEARAAGGRFHVVLGNHELMNLLGDWRYVVSADYASFAPDETAAMRDAERARLVQRSGDVAPARASVDEFPRGFFARQAAFAPTGRYGEWLLTLPAILVIGDTAYVHGGLPKLVADEGLAINARVREGVARYLALREELAMRGVLWSPDRRRDVADARAALDGASRDLKRQIEEFLALEAAPELGVQGPLWYRGSLYCKPLLEAPTLDAALAKLGTRRVIVGHTPTGDRRVQTLYDGRIVAADTGMLADYFYGRPAALDLTGTSLAVQYLPPEASAPHEADGSAILYGLTDAQLHEALERGAVTSVERASVPWRVNFEHDGRRFEALFYPNGAERAGELELAAGALDGLLGTTLIAPTVARAIDGEDGALQLRYAGAITERERTERKLSFSGWCPVEPQLKLMYTFDVLAMTLNRGPDTVLFANDLTDLTLTDHRQSFGTERSLPPRLDVSRLEIPAALAASLRALDEPQLRAALGDWLDAARIAALLARRDALLAGVRR
jgi:hypothetical protein